MEQFPLIIIGAGPTGLGAAWHWQKNTQEKYVLLEASDRAGGLSASFLDDSGFTWDLGSHLQFSHYKYLDDVLDEVLDGSQWNRHQRSTFVWFADRFVPYPFQHNLHHLPAQDRWDCVKGLLDRPGPAPRDADFATWCRSTFGDAITELFMRPYNEKLWDCRLEEMTADWIAERVAVPKLRDILRNLCFSVDQSDWGPNANFRYPRHGGAGSVWIAVAARLHSESVRYGSHVSCVDIKSKFIVTECGQKLCYDKLLTTLPLPVLQELTRNPQELECIAGLRHTRTHIVGLGIAGRMPSALTGHCWSYFPQVTIPFYRLTVLSNLSESMTPAGICSWSLMAELTEPEGKLLQHSECVNSVIDAVERLQLAARTDIVSTWHRRLPFGYPVPTPGRDNILDRANKWLESCGIYSRGRFGAWKYEVSNQDHSFMQGVECVGRMINGTEESTLFPHVPDSSLVATSAGSRAPVLTSPG